MNNPIVPGSPNEESALSGQDLSSESPVQPDPAPSAPSVQVPTQAEIRLPDVAPSVFGAPVVPDQVAYQPAVVVPVEYPSVAVSPVAAPPVPPASAYPPVAPSVQPVAVPPSGFSQVPVPPQGYQPVTYAPVTNPYPVDSAAAYPPAGNPTAVYPPVVYPPVGDPAAAYPPADTMPTPAPKKSKKPLIIALGAVAAVILIAVGVLAFQEFSRASAYDRASAAFDRGDYFEARDGFRELGDYRDSSVRLQRSGEYCTYEDAVTFFEAGDYEVAREKFNSVMDAGVGDIVTWIARIDLAEGIAFFEEGDWENASLMFYSASTAGLPEAEEWIDKTDYALAEARLTEGDVEGAYYAFLALGDYSDAAARATACTQPLPASGIVHQDGAFYYDYCALDITYNYGSPAFFKLYSGSTLAASLFINAGDTVRVYLTPGSYTIKEGSGEVWFGPDLAFGEQGWYSTMTFDDTGTDFFTINDGDLMTLVCGTEGGGNVSERDEDLSSF